MGMVGREGMVGSDAAAGKGGRAVFGMVGMIVGSGGSLDGLVGRGVLGSGGRVAVGKLGMEGRVGIVGNVGSAG